MSPALKCATLALVLTLLAPPARALDGDGDGVDDALDVCPNTPPGVVVDAQGRPRADLDGDCDGDLDDFALFAAGYTGPLYPPEVCHDGEDNDHDGLVDCEDAADCPAGAACGAHAACSPAADCACDPGYADCNGLYPDGCETDTQTDPEHCGGCTACPLPPHVTARTCIDGQCIVTGCASGWADCNGVFSDGCEADILNEPQHCGSCNPCPMPPNVATRTCINGQCRVGACVAGYADCNGIFSDGCEVNLNASLPCAGAQAFAPISGDLPCSQYHNVVDRGETWRRVWVIEDDTNPFVPHTLFFDATLQSPAGMDYDLYLYDACGGNLLDSSTLGAGQQDQVELTWNDSVMNDDSRELWIEVRYYSGSSCATWNLLTYGGCSP